MTLHRDLHIGTCNADECEAQKNVRRHPGPVGVPAVEQGQDDTEPDPAERDGPGLRVAYQEEERRSRQASENAPPAVVFHEEMAEMVNRDQNDRGGFQPVGVVNGVRCCSSNAWRRCIPALNLYASSVLGVTTEPCRSAPPDRPASKGFAHLAATALAAAKVIDPVRYWHPILNLGPRKPILFFGR